MTSTVRATTAQALGRALTATMLCAGLVLGALLPTLAATAAPAAAEATMTVDTAPAGVRDSVVRLYQATFDRAPDEGGLRYWLDPYVRGLGLGEIAEQFMRSPEWRSTYGDVDDGAFVDLLYRNVLDRGADADGRAYWVDQLRQGTARSALLTSFSESAELVSRTRTAAPVAPPAPAFPKAPAGSGAGRRIVYDNSGQRVWMVDAFDLTVDTYLVSGKRATPGPGTYRVFSKSEKAYAGHDGITMDHMVRFAHGEDLAIGFHSIPCFADGRPLQSESQLGTYRSSGCVRQSDAKAAALYAWADIGTAVVVLP